MMSVYLRESYPGEEVGIMEVLRGGGFASGRDINYHSCSDIKQMDLGRFTSKQAGIVGSCEQVATLMRSQEAKIAAFSNNLRNSLSKQVNCIINGEIMPVFTNFAAQKIMETDVMRELTEDIGYIVTTGAPKLKTPPTPQKSEAELEEEFNKLPKPEKEILEKYRAKQVKKAEEIKAQQAAENKEQVVGSPKAVSTKTELQRKAAQTIRELSDGYNEFAQKYPLLAEYGLSALNVALKTAIGGPVGLAKAVSEEVIGEVSGRVAAKYIEKAVDSAAYQIQANNPDLSEEDARTLASASTLGLVMFTFGPKIAKEMLSDLKHLIKMKKLSPPPKIEIDVDGNAKPIDPLEQKPVNDILKNAATEPIIQEPLNNVPENVVSKEAYKTELRASMEEPFVRDQKLREIINDLYKPGSKVGSAALLLRYGTKLSRESLLKGETISIKHNNTQVL